MRTFQIFGLPRSGTAWIASVINMHGGVFCYHEACRHGYAQEILQNTEGYDYVGDSSSGIFLDGYISDAVICIDRNPDECYESSRRALGVDIPIEGWKYCLNKYKDWRSNFSTVIDYSELFKVETVEHIIKYACPEIDPDIKKIEHSLNLRIQLTELKYEPEVLDALGAI